MKTFEFKDLVHQRNREQILNEVINIMGVREAKVEKYFNNKIEFYGGITRKWVSPGRDGVPDRIVIYRGKVYFVEVKTSDGELSKNQRRERKKLDLKGAQVFTVYGHDGVDAWVREVLLK